MLKSELVKEGLAVFEGTLRSENSKEASKVYDNWAENFDKHSNAYGFDVIAKAAAQLCGKYVENSKKTTLLDVGAGTGRVAYYLRTSENFEGIIDILDGSIDMLYRAKKKDLNCRCIIQHLVEGDIPLPEKTYDVVVSTGAFLPNHLPIAAVKACLKLVKPNGFLIINNEPTAGKAYYDDFTTLTGNMIEAKTTALLESLEITATVGVFNIYVFQRCADE